MDVYEFRSAQPGDITCCMAIRGRTRENALSITELAQRGVTEKGWREQTTNGRLIGHVCTLDQEIIGYSFADRTRGEIVVLALLPDHESKGIGKQLLTLITDDLRELGFKRLFLESAADPNTRSHGFYRHLGWSPTGVATGYGDEVLELVQ